MSDIGPGDAVIVIDGSNPDSSEGWSEPPPTGTRQYVVAVLESQFGRSLQISGFPNCCTRWIVAAGVIYPAQSDFGWGLWRFRKAGPDDLADISKLLDQILSLTGPEKVNA